MMWTRLKGARHETDAETFFSLPLLRLVGLLTLLLSSVVLAEDDMHSAANDAQHAAPHGKLSLLTLVPAFTPVSDYRGDVWSRATLLGDLGGRRQELYEQGIALDVGLTQVPQGVVSGGREKEWEYNGVADYSLALDSGRLGLWPGGLVVIHGRTKFGRSVNSQAGSLSPVNFSFLTPDALESSVSFLEEYYLVQGLTTKVSVVAGRILFGSIGDLNRFAGNEKTQFLNTALRNSPLLGIISTAQSLHGVALNYQPNPNLIISPFVLSNNDEDGVDGSPGGLFSEYSAGVQLQFFWTLADRLGYWSPLFGYTSKNTTDFDNTFLLRDALLGLATPEKKDNWVVGFTFDQYLYMPDRANTATVHSADFGKEPEGIGVFMRFHYGPEDRNPWNMFVSGGLGGRGVVPARPNDRYGLGFYSLIESDNLKDQPILGRALDTEWGMEMFYNIALTPWLQLSPSLQYIQSGLPRVDDSVLIATRIQMYF